MHERQILKSGVAVFPSVASVFGALPNKSFLNPVSGSFSPTFISFLKKILYIYIYLLFVYIFNSEHISRGAAEAEGEAASPPSRDPGITT